MPMTECREVAAAAGNPSLRRSVARIRRSRSLRTLGNGNQDRVTIVDDGRIEDDDHAVKDAVQNHPAAKATHRMAG
jgi:hypothetical protein